jgi:MOSC domain-containing protein YiiM
MKFTEKIKTHVLHSASFSENLTIYEIMSKNVEESERWQMILLRMRVEY